MPQRFARVRVLAAAALLLAAAARPASADSASHVGHLDRMMAAIALQSARDAATITRVYRPHLRLLLLHGYSDLEGALATGGLAPLPVNAARFNLAPRLDGPHPIGEKDLDNQVTSGARATSRKHDIIGRLVICDF
jgi:hypothetical protein